MVQKCSVPNCRGTYDKNSEFKVRLFKFPKDEEMRSKWRRFIRRDNFKVTDFSRVSYYMHLKIFIVTSP